MKNLKYMNMKRFLIYAFPLSVILSSCAYNENTGESEPTWLFWVFLGLIAFGLILGVVVKSRRANNNRSEADIKSSEENDEKEELENLEKMKNEGLISDEEYERMKKRYLDK